MVITRKQIEQTPEVVPADTVVDTGTEQTLAVALKAVLPLLRNNDISAETKNHVLDHLERLANSTLGH